MPITSLNEKFAHELSDIFDAEHQFLEAQQAMVQQTSDAWLRNHIDTHIRETEGQIQNLTEVLNHLGLPLQRVRCEGAAGLVAEGQKSIQEAGGNPAILDCLIASAATKVEHYEIASYRGLVRGMELLGADERVQLLLRQNLQQEEQTAQLIEDHTPKLLQTALQARTAGSV